MNESHGPGICENFVEVGSETEATETSESNADQPSGNAIQDEPSQNQRLDDSGYGSHRSDAWYGLKSVAELCMEAIFRASAAALVGASVVCAYDAYQRRDWDSNQAAKSAGCVCAAGIAFGALSALRSMYYRPKMLMDAITTEPAIAGGQKKTQ